MDILEIYKTEQMDRNKIEEKTKQILKEHELYSIPIDPIRIANLKNIKVNNAVFSEDNLSGMISKRGENIQILVNQNDSPFRKRFTIAHELGHVFLHLVDKENGEFIDTDSDLFRDYTIHQHTNTIKSHEVEANNFAASLLMPEDLVKEEYKNIKDLKTLARLFNVSEVAMGFRLNRLGLI